MKFLPVVALVSMFPAVAMAAEVQTCFTLGDDCQSQIVRFIDGARKAVRVQAYGFTAEPIAAALARAHARGVAVWVVLDQSQLGGRGNKASTLSSAGVPVQIDDSHGAAHNKVILVDIDLVITGSYNFASAAHSRNAENVAFIRDGGVFISYLKNFNTHLSHSFPYEEPGAE